MIKCNKRHGGWDYQRFGKLPPDCAPDVTLETQGHMGNVYFDGLFVRNTVTCWLVNNVYVDNPPVLPNMGYVTIREADPSATTKSRMTQIGALMGHPLTCRPTTSDNGMKNNGKSQTSRGLSLLDEAKDN